MSRSAFEHKELQVFGLVVGLMLLYNRLSETDLYYWVIGDFLYA
jgi:hypothetical protein